MAQDREQDRTEERDGASRPVTAAARRERRASARGAGDQKSKAPTTARTRRARDARAADGAVEAATSSSTTVTKGRPTPARDKREKRPSVIARTARFVREVVSELRKVIWPTRKQQITYTIVVLVFVTFVVAFVAGLDLGFAKLVFLVFA